MSALSANRAMDDAMRHAQRFLDRVIGQFQRVRETQWEAVETAGRWVAEALMQDGWWYTFGTGHSRLLAEEVFHRAGGLARAVPILDERVQFTYGAARATAFEREEGAAASLLEPYKVKAGDVLMVASNSGRNALPIDMALLGREKGMKIIALVNKAHADAWPSRHPSGKNLAEVADLVLDQCGVDGDACLEVDDVPGKIGPTSTMAGALLVELVVVSAVAQIRALGGDPEVYISSNSNGDAHNETLEAKYRNHIPNL